MEIPPSEIIDRMSIVKLKIERISEPTPNAEFEALQKSLQEFKDRGIEIKKEWFDELYEINKKEWDLLEQMNNEKEKNGDFEKIGRLYIMTEKINKERAEAKNKIVEQTGKGFKEIKRNHPSA